jgi:hypothetical protein
LSQLDATHGIYRTNYQYLRSWTQKWLFSETSSEVKNKWL